MRLFLTGATGYLGGRVLSRLIARRTPVSVLVRASNRAEAIERLWRSLQLDLRQDELREAVDGMAIYCGDLSLPRFGLELGDYEKLVHTTSEVIHGAATLNRRSEAACYRGNVLATMNVLELARAAIAHHELRRFTNISTVSVAGDMPHQSVAEDEMINWARPDVDPYGRTKKLAERLVHELLPVGCAVTVRPSAIIGDSALPETTQFDILAGLALMSIAPVIPAEANWRLDLVPVDYVTRCILAVHFAKDLEFSSYNASAGETAPTIGEVVGALRPRWLLHGPAYVPHAKKALEFLTSALMRTPKRLGLQRHAARANVFLPYLTANSVFDNSRTRRALGETPESCTTFLAELLRFAIDNRFQYPYRAWTIS